MNLYPLRAALLLVSIATPLASYALSAPRDEVAAFLATPLDAIEAINPRHGQAPPSEIETRDFTRGSAIRRTFSVAAGDTLSFDWFFGTDEGAQGANNDIIDFAFYSLNGAPTLLASVDDPLELAHNSPFTEQLLPLTAGGSDYFRTVDLAFDTAGDYTLGFAVVDTVDTVVESGLVLDNFRVNGNLVDNGGFETNAFDGTQTTFPGWETLGDVSVWDNDPVAPEGNVGAALRSGDFEPNPVPLPAGVWLLGSALATFGWRRRRRR